MEVTRFYRALVYATACLTFIVVVVGAYVRLADAGLGCPDWPGCYGAMSPAHAEAAIAEAVEAQGGEHGPVSLGKAWKEMAHRYLAGTLGLCVLAIAVMAWQFRERLGQSAALPASTLALVIAQALLGMWTVTLLLKPVVVTLHLLGGMSTLALLVWLASRQRASKRRLLVSPRRVRAWARLALVVIAVQIALGGWVSSNYAALACIDFPTCHGEWIPRMDFAHAFQLVRDLGRTASGEHLSYDALTAIHWTHRAGALVAFVVVGALAYALLRRGEWRTHGIALALLLTLQVLLGITNILSGLPLTVAVAHNALAALLLAFVVLINCDLSRVPRTPS